VNRSIWTSQGGFNKAGTAADPGDPWGDTYGFDSFGNLLSKTPTAGSAPTLSQAANPANNQIVGLNYDANGNQLASPNSDTLTYDAENRLTQNGGSVQYAYDSQNKRVWEGNLSSGSLTGQSVIVYGIDGQKLGSYSLSVSSGEITDSATTLAVYFAGKRVATIAGGVATPFVQDRLGSNAGTGASPVSLYPWGEDRGTPAPNDQVKFATNTRDSATLLDYADQRYYSNQYGRLITPDPYQGASGGPGDPTNPQSWNRYGYTTGDPVNFDDPQGLFQEGPSLMQTPPVLNFAPQPGSGGWGTSSYFSTAIALAVQAAVQLAVMAAETALIQQSSAARVEPADFSELCGPVLNTRPKHRRQSHRTFQRVSARCRSFYADEQQPCFSLPHQR
jgi:RHS repeat-associated protein